MGLTCGTSSPPMRSPANRGPIAAIAAGFLGIVYFYRGFFLTGFTSVQGDEADGRLTSFIGTHWLDPLRWGSWQDLGMFYPLTETIGFSDWLFLNGLIALPFALVGIPDYAAFQWSLIALSAVGYASMVVLLRRGPRVSWPIAIAASLVFVFGNNMYVASEHPQLAPIALLPLVALLVLDAWRRRSWVLAWAVLPGVVIGLILITSFYTFWYLLLTSMVLAVVGLIYSPSRSWIVANLRRLLTLAAGIVIGTTPFVLLAAPIYLAALDLGEGQRSTADILYWSLSPKDFVNVSTSNGMWGWLIDALYPPSLDWRSRPSEWAYAPTPLIWLGLVVAVVIAVRHRRVLATWGHAAVVAMASGVVLEVLLLRLGPFFPWGLVVNLPGATAVRALGRLQLVATFLILIGISVLINAWWRSRPRSNRAHLGLAIVLALVVIEQVSIEPMQENGPQRRDDLASIAIPPAECRTFVVIQPLYPEDVSPPIQIDAMLVSRATGLKTMHGYTGIEPPGWDLTNSWEPDYRSRIQDRIAQFDASTITCGLDLSQGAWLTPTQLQSFLGSGA